MRTKILAASLFCCFFIFITVNTLRSQTIFTESFEGTFPPAGWTIINAGTGGIWQANIDPAYSFAGLKSMQCPSVGNVTRNAWAITQNLSLIAGTYYRISYWYREAANARIEKMKVTLGNAATIAAQTTILHDYTDIENLNNVEGADVFSVPSNGNYNIGFYCYSTANTSASLLIDSVLLQQIAPVNCSGNPMSGPVIGPSSACSGVNFTLNLSGTYVSNGLTLQWQSSPASANTFTDIAGANSQLFTSSQTTAKDYRCIVTCSNGGASVVSNVFPVSMNTLCYCTLPTTGCGLGYIGNVTIGSINNNSVCGGGYINYSGYVSPTDLVIGSTIPISVTPGGIAISQSIAVWIDYNRNGLFDASEYKSLGGGTAPLSSTINIPVNALLGFTTMRVKSKGGATVASSASCTSYSDGETEDYIVNIAPFPPCTGTPTGGTTNSTITTICPDINFVLKVSGASSGNSGYTYQWQKSPDGTAWTNIAGALADTLLISQTAVNYYRRQIICSGSGQSAFSTSLFVGINPFTSCYCIPQPADCGGFRYAGIEHVIFSNINNASGCAVNGYTDYTGTFAAANIQAGTYVNITVKFLSQNTINAKGVVVGIDFNHNGIFDNSEASFAASITQAVLAIRIPFNAITGNTRMRVRASFYSGSSPGFCGLDQYGETEDYLINISAASTPGPNFSFYVNPWATGNGNGLSWTNAFTSLMTTLDVVLPADTIRVAKGTYLVSGFPYYFNIKDSVVLLGGYSNSGNPTDAQRNWGTNQTILSAAGVPVLVRGANAFILDGFILQDVYSYPNEGGAIRIYSGILPKIRHCVFRNNHCFSAGSGSALRITNSSPVISDCYFINNQDDGGSTVLNESNSATVFTNCIFSKNNAVTSIIENNNSITTLINTDLVSNRTNSNATLFGNNGSTFNIKNSIFFNNEKNVINGYGGYSIDSSDIELVNSTASVSNTITQVYDYGNTMLLSKDPKFKDTSSIAGPDNFYFTSDDGLQLNNPCSPAMNAGSNTSAFGITLDILGNTRVVSSIVDIGAYEVQTAALAIPKTLYVNKTATGNGSGSSWANAMTELQTAMQSCSDTIRVAAGTYYPSDTDEKKSIWLENKRVILGGYPNTGNPTDAQRDPAINLAILSGEIPNGNGARSDILLRGRTVDSTSITDGLVIKKADGNYTNAMGAIYLVKNTNPVFRNCTISDNSSNGRGAGLFIINSGNPKFLNSVFERNELTNIGEGAAVANINSKPVFLSCIFRNNTNYIAGVSPSSGGAVYNSGSNAVFDGCTFLKNVANNWGGAMDNVNSNPVISNCQFLGNLIAFGGNAIDINNNQSSPQVSNTFFSDSSGCNYGGSIVNQNQSNGSFTKCEFKNGHASYAGGACYNDNSSPLFLRCVFTGTGAGDGGVINNQNASNPVIVNCISSGSSASGQGSFMYNNNSNPVIINTTVVNATLPSTGNSFRGGVIVNTGTAQSTLSNCMLWGNTVISGQNVPNGDILDLSNVPTQMNNSISQVFGTTGVNGNLVGVDPIFLNRVNPAGADNIFYTNDDGLNLASCSPAMNTGLNASIAGYNIDILGNARVYNSIVDMGAYEIQALPGLVTNTWTGLISSVWENPLNWSLGVLPNPCTKVIINSGTVVLNSNTTIYNLTINPGANLTVHTGYSLIILH